MWCVVLTECVLSVPAVLVECAAAIEARGPVDGVYRLSGGAGLTQRLRAAFDAGAAPDLAAPATLRDPHAVPSLLKMYFRSVPPADGGPGCQAAPASRSAFQLLYICKGLSLYI